MGDEWLAKQWTPIIGFDGYSVNPLGQVRNDSYHENGQDRRLLRIRVNREGVPYVGMMRDGQQCVRSLPRLVAKTFIEQPNSIFDTPINLDGNRTNCHVMNLAWRPRWYAVNYQRQFEIERYEHPINVPVREADTDEEFPDSMAAACYYGILEREVVLSILNNTLTWPTFQKFVIAD